MKMFPHPFVPFFHAHDVWDALIHPADETTKKPVATPSPASDKSSVKIDLEYAVSVILSARGCDRTRSRQDVRRDVMKTLPPDSIDWETVDWVQVWPFQTGRI